MIINFINIVLAIAIIFFVSVLYVVAFEYITSKYKRCKNCGHNTNFTHRDMDGKWYKCPNCGNKDYFICYRNL